VPFRKLALPVLLATAFSALTFGGILIYFAKEHNAHSLTAEKNGIHHELSNLHLTLKTITNDNAWWDSAVENLYLTENLSWAEKTLGESASSYSYMDGLIILRKDTSLLYQSAARGTANVEDIRSQLAVLTKTMSVTNISNTADKSGFIKSEGKIFSYAMSMVRPAGESVPTNLLPNSMPLIIFYSELTPKRLNTLLENRGISELSININDTSSSHGSDFSIFSFDGTKIATLHWKGKKLGSEIFRELVLPYILYLIITVGVLVLFFIRITKVIKQLDSDNRSKSSFLASMSHEIRTPLNSILGFTELVSLELFGKVEGDKNKEYLTLIKNSGEHLLSIINDILDLSKLEAGKFDVYSEKLEITHVIKSSIKLVEATAHENSVTILNNSEPALLKSDERIIRQILLNILSNAIKFSLIGGSITIKGKLHSTHYSLSIKDTGIGMTQEQIELSLAPFGQIANEYTRSHSGTGLGLPLVDRFIKLLDGHMTINSKPDYGTTVTLKLPLHTKPKNI